MKVKLEKFITSIDIFGENISLRLNSETTSKTFFGGLITMLLLGGLTIVFWVFFLDVINKINPNVSAEIKVTNPRPKLNLNRTSMAIAFGLTDMATGIVDKPEYFKYEASIMYNENKANGISTTTVLPIKKCNETDFPTIPSETFYNVALDSMYCIEDQDIDIFGFWDEPTIQFLQLKLFFCQNITGEENCASIEEVQDFLRQEPFFFNIFFVNTNINPQNYTTPITRHIFTRYKGIRAETFKLLEFFIKEEELITDDTILFSLNNKYNHTISYDYSEPDDTDLTEELCLMNFMLLSSNLRVTHYRIYKKASAVLADLGGLASLFMFSAQIICYIFANIKRDEEILNKIFDFDLKEYNKEDKMDNIGNNIQANNDRNKIKNKTLNLKNYLETSKIGTSNSLIPLNNYIKNNESNTINMNKISSINNLNLPVKNTLLIRKPTLKVDSNTQNFKDVIKKVLALKESNYQLRFSFCEILKIFICRCLINNRTKLKYNLYKKSESVLDEYLDISRLVQKLEELEKLKMILLNNEQIALFDFIAKDICSMNVDKIKNSKINNMKEFIKDKEKLANIIVDFIQNINNISDESKINEIDVKLFDLLHDEFKENLIKFS